MHVGTNDLINQYNTHLLQVFLMVACKAEVMQGSQKTQGVCPAIAYNAS